MAYVSNANKQTPQDIADKIGIKHQYGATVGLGQQAMQQYGMNNIDKQSSNKSSDQQHKQLDAITMKSIAYDLMYDQLQAQQYVKNMANNAVGIGDPSLVAITNVNAQIAAGTHNYRDIQPYGNYNALQDQPSQDTGTRVEPLTQKMTIQIILEQGSEKQKEEVYQQDKEQITMNEQQELGNDVLLGVPPAPPIIMSQPPQQLQQQPSLVQEDAQQQQIKNLQAQQMTDMTRAMNYKLGSMDWGQNPVNATQFPLKDISINQSREDKLGQAQKELHQ
ncbi:MAG: hypothetical protein EZS28_025232 [Streblomastix strix]|uniref:Uncharacterized protein n=1 Tax=Streblomastix strix TaxID=222440 RepID=A0A5J4V9W9_9EUKA|nr:MAG: hypothetical protein EZS28_025232 [Streblomastix strix]